MTNKKVDATVVRTLLTFPKVQKGIALIVYFLIRTVAYGCIDLTFNETRSTTTTLPHAIR